MKREYDDYLRDMLDNAELALSFVIGMEYDEFFEDEKSTYAVMRALEIIGEAARKIPEDVRNANPEIPWREITKERRKAPCFSNGDTPHLRWVQVSYGFLKVG